MADKEEEFSIQEVPVYKRDESPMGIFGLTWSDMGLLVGTFFVAKWVTGRMIPTLMVTSVIWLYIKKLKHFLPERFFRKFIDFQLEKNSVFRALGRDTEWAPPIIVGPEKSPIAMLWESMTGPPKRDAATKAREEKRRANLRKRRGGGV